MNLDKLNDWPSDKATKRLVYLGYIILWIAMAFFMYLSSLEIYPVTFLESQLSFSGSVIKSHFREMSAEDMRLYVIWQLVDIAYDCAYILMFFGLSLFLARKFDEGSGWRKSGLLIALLGIMGAISDIIENILIIMMTTDPQGFPDIWAVAHSWFAVIKFTLWGINAVWIIWADLKLFKKDIITKKPFLGAICVVASHHWGTVLTAISLALGIE